MTGDGDGGDAPRRDASTLEVPDWVTGGRSGGSGDGGGGGGGGGGRKGKDGDDLSYEEEMASRAKNKDKKAMYVSNAANAPRSTPHATPDPHPSHRCPAATETSPT